MNRCSRCVMPDTRPDTPFVNGVCAACLTREHRPEHFAWDIRRRLLEDLLEANHNKSGYDCIVPSSGGKDSTYQVMTLLGMGAKPLVVTATTCHLTPMGRANIDNLARYADTIEVSPSRSVRAKMNRLGLEVVGDISWPEHVAIFTVPFRIAAHMGIPLIFYGENPQNQYGGPLGTEDAVQMTARWRSEFGGFLGLRPIDLVGKPGLTKRDIVQYTLPDERLTDAFQVQAHFLGQYLPWDSHENARIAIKAGMIYNRPSPANWWEWENLDNAQTGLHDYGMYLKYGYGRGCAQISVDVREGLVPRDIALQWVRRHDGLFPTEYAGVPLEQVLSQIHMSREKLQEHLDAFTNWDLFRRTVDDALAPVVLVDELSTADAG